MQQPTNTATPGFVNFVEDVFKNADTLDDDLRAIADRIGSDQEEKKKQAQEQADKVGNALIFQRVKSFLREPTNLFLTVVGFVLFIIFVRKL